MRISVITISYNQVKYLPQCCESIRSQLDHDDQHIIVDPGSVDASREYIADLISANRNIQAVFRKDSGPAEGLNNGFSEATGDILAYINADDFLLPGALDYVRNYFLRNSQIEVLIGAIKIADEKGKLKLRGRVADSPSFARLASDSMQYYQQATFIKSAAYDKIAGFNDHNKTCWDRELIVDLMIAGCKIHVCSKPLAAFRFHSNSITGAGSNLLKYRKDRIRIASKGAKLSKSRGVLNTFFYRVESKLNPIRIIRQLRP